MFKKVAEHSRATRRRSLRIGIRAARSSSTSAAEEPDAEPDRELRRREQRQRRLAAGHRGRHRPEPLHAVGQPRVPDLQSRRNACDARSRPATSSSPASRMLRKRRPATAATRSSSTTSSRTAGSRAQLAYPTYPERAVLPVRRGTRRRATRPGTWCAYQYVAHQTKLNDYPKFGVWPTQHAYMITVNQFSEPGDDWAGVGVFALERDADERLRQPRGCSTRTCSPSNRTSGAACSRPTSTAPRMPPADAPAPLIEVDDARMGSGALPAGSARRLERDRRLVGAPARSTSRTRAAPDGAVRRQPLRLRAVHPAAGHVERLDTLNDRLMYRMAYRNFGDHQAIVVNHSVDVDGADHAGVRWYELTKTSGNWSISQQGTYEPDTTAAPLDGLGGDGPRRATWPSASRPSNGTAPNYPSIRYAGRLATDPLGRALAGRGDAHGRHGLADRHRAAGATTR